MPTPSSWQCRCSCSRSASRTISAPTRSTPFSLPGIAHGVGRVDDQVLQHQPQHRARHAHGADVRSDSSASTTRRWRQASGTISSVWLTRSGSRTDSITVFVARGAHQLAQRGLHDRRLTLDHLDVRARLGDARRHLAATEAHELREIRVAGRRRRRVLELIEGELQVLDRRIRAAARSSFASRTPRGVMALPRLCSTPLASSAKPA